MRLAVAGPGDDAELRRLLRDNPMSGSVRISLEREPCSFLAASIEGHLHQTVTVRAPGDGRLLGIGSRAVMTAWVNGDRGPLGYLGGLRIDQTQSARRRVLVHGYRKLRELHGDGAAPFYLTTIVEDNRPARRLLEAGLEGLPRYRLLETLVTLVIPVGGPARRGRTRGEAGLQRGSAESLGELADCLERNGRRHQFARAWTVQDLESPERTRDLRPGDFLYRSAGGRVTGCLAVWDQSRFKQTVVRGYHPWLGRARPLVNALRPWLRQPRLPPPGGALRSAFVSHLAVDGDDPDTALALLRGAVSEARARGLDHLVLGLAARHPLCAAVERAFPHREYRSVLYQVYWEDDRERIPALDDRVPHPEVATL